jgi:hypothetical protein
MPDLAPAAGGALDQRGARDALADDLPSFLHPDDLTDLMATVHSR